MIIGWLFTEITAFLGWVITGFPAPVVPTWLGAITTDVAAVVNFINSLGAWIPSTLLVTVITAYVAVLLVAISIRVARWAQSSLSGGGGSVV